MLPDSNSIKQTGACSHTVRQVTCVFESTSHLVHERGHRLQRGEKRASPKQMVPFWRTGPNSLNSLNWTLNVFSLGSPAECDCSSVFTAKSTWEHTHPDTKACYALFCELKTSVHGIWNEVILTSFCTGILIVGEKWRAVFKFSFLMFSVCKLPKMFP